MVGDDFQRMRDDRCEGLEAVADAAGAAGQIDDEGALGDAGGGTRQRRERCGGESTRAQVLGDARRLALADRLGRLGRDVGR